MECEDALPTIKILLIGSSGVGKSAREFYVEITLTMTH